MDHTISLLLITLLISKQTSAWLLSLNNAHDKAPIFLQAAPLSSSTFDITAKNSFLIRASFDGRHFTGWTAGNDPLRDTTIPAGTLYSGRKRRRNSSHHRKGFVRSVQGVLRQRLARLYGDVDPEHVTVEGCSRTDKGVHATALVAQVYCRNPDNNSSLLPLPKLPHDMAFCLNRMCEDVQIMAVAPVPLLPSPSFHPSTCAVSKTYCYTLSIGPRADPTRLGTVWYAGRYPHNSTSGGEALSQRMTQVATLLTGCHDFRAFRSAPRSASDARKFKQQTTICTVHAIEVAGTSWHGGTTTYTIRIKGDRFLYKMVRWMVGVMVDVSLGVVSIEQVQQALLQQTQHTQNAWQCAPAHGLVLENVEYPFPIAWESASC